MFSVDNFLKIRDFLPHSQIFLSNGSHQSRAIARIFSTFFMSLCPLLRTLKMLHMSESLVCLLQIIKEDYYTQLHSTASFWQRPTSIDQKGPEIILLFADLRSKICSKTLILPFLSLHLIFKHGLW